MESPDVAPPPYSETDIYSTSGHSPIIINGSNNNADDASIIASSSQSNIIYTPPETPRDSQHSISGVDDHHTTASAQAYFDSRSATGRNPGASIVQYITTSGDPAPADFPCPGWASERQTTEQDWQTFINYLIPEHAAKANAHIIDRKLRAEQENAHSLMPGIAEAQLDQIRSLASTPERLQSYEDTVFEWNAGFIVPRGVTIRLDYSSTPASPRMPGAWDNEFDSTTAEQEPQPSPERGGFRGFFNRPSFHTDALRNFRMDGTGRGLRLGPITTEGDRVTIGSSFEADSRGVRWNGQEISSSGPFSRPNARGPSENAGPSGHQRERRFGERGRVRDRDHRRHEGRHGRRHRRRSASAGSASSDASSSSGSSPSSIGSLPDWDDLRDAQLPAVKTSITAWLSHPYQPVSKVEFKRAKAEIKAAKLAPSQTSVPIGERQEVKQLLAQWSRVKDVQKVARKAAKKEKRAQKKVDRKARKQGHGERRGRGLWWQHEERDGGRGSAGHRPAFMSLSGVPGPQFAGVSAPQFYGVPGPAFFGPGRTGGPGFFRGRGGPCRDRGGSFGSRGGCGVNTHREIGDRRGSPGPFGNIPGAWPAGCDHIGAPARAPASPAPPVDPIPPVSLARASAEAVQAFAAHMAIAAREQATGVQAAALQEATVTRSTAKYTEAKKMEYTIAAKMSTAHRLQTEMEAEWTAPTLLSTGEAERLMQKHEQMQRKLETLEVEIEALGKTVERLRIEADDEFARELKDEERRGV